MATDVAENEIYCAICETVEPSAAKVLECVNCHVCHHFKCKKIIGNAIAKWRKKDYFCSTQCQEIYLKSTNVPNTESLLLAEFQKVVSEIQNLKDEQHSTRKYVSKAVGEIEKSQNFLAHKFDEVCNNIKKLENEQQTLKGSVGVVEERYVQLSETVNRLESEVDGYRRSALSCNAILLGIPETKDENLAEVLVRFAAVLGLKITNEFFCDVKRLRDSKSESRTSPVRVVFASESNKEQFFAKKKEAGQVQVSSLGGCYSGLSGRIMLRDEMTPHGLALLREAKDVQEQLDLKYVWPGRNGVILVKKTAKSKVEYIQNRNDLKKLNKLSSKRGLEMSLSGPISSSSVIEQDPKRR